MRKHQQGFTLIELMIVVAIIGILSAVGVPMYQDYVKKSELASGTATLRGLITKAELYLLDHGSFPANLSDIQTSSAAGGTLGTISIQGSNQLLFSFDTNNSALANASVVFSRDTSNGWSCSVSGATNVTRPKGCQ